MSLILRAKAGSLSAQRHELASRVAGFDRLQALPAEDTCDLSNLESPFTQYGRPCPTFPSDFYRFRSRPSAAPRAGRPPPLISSRTHAEGSCCFFGLNAIRIDIIPWAITIAL
jgi:hypothetical protein